MEDLQFQCCFCGEGVSRSFAKDERLDPCAVVLIGNWQGPEDEQVTQQFFCHLSCFKKAMYPNVPVGIEDLADDSNGS